MSIHLYSSQFSRDEESLDRIFSRNTNNVEEDADNTHKHNLMSNKPTVRQKVVMLPRWCFTTITLQFKVQFGVEEKNNMRETSKCNAVCCSGYLSTLWLLGH